MSDPTANHPFVRALAARGVGLTPLLQEGRTATLTWDTGVTGPVMAERILVVIPDMHLSDRGPGDVFVGLGAGQREKMLHLLDALIATKQAFPELRVVQLGDIYDVWRAYPEYKDHPTANYRRIEDAHGDIIGKLTQDLRARVCVGNHDAPMGPYPPSWARGPNGPTGQLAYGHTFASGRVLAFHGHQQDVIGQEMAAQGGLGTVQFATLAAKLLPASSQLAQEYLDLATVFFADPDTAFFRGHWPLFAEAPSGLDGFTSPVWCDRQSRDLLGSLVSAIGDSRNLRLAIVGHSHCPGISWIEVHGRRIPLVDAGSWIQDKRQIMIAVEGSLTLYSVG
ncbi:MAG: metallophosphoesterase [Polyangiaceae bacterium]